MIALEEISDGVYAPADPVVRIGAEELQFLRERLPNSSRGRVRLCTHRHTDEALQEMFIAFARDSYVRPSVHVKDEALFIIDGSATAIFFDDKGRVTDLIRLGDGSFGDRYRSFRVPAGQCHFLLVESEILLAHEVTVGPFNPSDSTFATWAPSEGDRAGVAGFLERLEDAVRSGIR